MKILNVCEGNDAAVIDRIVDAVRGVASVTLLDVSSDEPQSGEADVG